MRKHKFLVAIFIVLLLSSINVMKSTANEINETLTKRIISVVYDDSYSMTKSEMFPNKQDDAYAQYALENVIGFMNDNDELNVVRMSNKIGYLSYKVNSIEAKKNSINEISAWNNYASETPFEAIYTAIDFLKEKKQEYGANDNIEYWLLVLTDGELENQPHDLQEYFNNVKAEMSDVKYDVVWVCIGNTVSHIFTDKIKNIMGQNYIASDNDNAICKAVYDACDTIYGRASFKKESFTISDDGKTLNLNINFPTNRIMVFEQSQEVPLKRIIAPNNKTYDNFKSITTEKRLEPTIKSLITEIDSDYVVPSGNITLEFEDAIDLDENKFIVMVDWAIDLNLGLIDADGNFTKTNTNFYNEGDTVELLARVYSRYDNSVIDLSNFINQMNVTYTNENNTYSITNYDDSEKSFKFSRTLKKGSNVFSAQMILLNYFRLKSNIIDVYVDVDAKISVKIDNDTIEVGKKYSDYEKVGTTNLVFENLPGDERANIEFENVPDGLQLKFNDTIVKNDKIETIVRNGTKNVIDIYRNKNYKDTETKNIHLNLNLKRENTNEKLLAHYFDFTIIPKNRNITLSVEKMDGIDISNLDSSKAYKKNLLFVAPMIDGINISKDELKKSTISLDTSIKTKSDVKYKLAEKDGNYGFYIYLKSPFNWFDRGEDFDLIPKIIPELEQTVVVGPTHHISIQNNLIPVILTFVLWFIIIWYIFGIFRKPRFEKKNHKIIVTEQGKELYNGPINVDGFPSSLIPYVPETGRAYDLKVKAGDTKSKIVVDKVSMKEGMFYDNEEVSTKKDLKIYEDTPLEFRQNRNKKQWVYTDVVTNDSSDNTENNRRRRRR